MYVISEATKGGIGVCSTRVCVHGCVCIRCTWVFISWNKNRVGDQSTLRFFVFGFVFTVLIFRNSAGQTFTSFVIWCHRDLQGKGKKKAGNTERKKEEEKRVKRDEARKKKGETGGRGRG